MDDRKPPHVVPPRGDEVAELVSERLCAVIRAVDGHNVDTNGTELWFDAEAASGLQVRLSSDECARCFDRSANFAISYGGLPSADPTSAAFRDVVDAIKQIDGSPIDGVATAFRAASEAVTRRFADPNLDRLGDCEERHGDGENSNAQHDAMFAASRSGVAVGLQRAARSTVRWERPRTRELNVIFLDLCSRVFAREGQALSPLHWGFWPTGTRALAIDVEDYDPLRAFSDNLLAHIPAGVSRILDVGCGLGFNEERLAAQNKHVTALSPVAHHCRVIEQAQLPGVSVQCARFEELVSDQRYDLLLFSESVNHFALDEEFFVHCRQFLADPGFILMADDLTEERARMIETQRLFRVIRSVDITANVAPTTQLWLQQLRVVTAYHAALMSILELHDPQLAAGVQEVLADLDSSELKLLLSGQMSPPTPKGRYMIYLLEPAEAAVDLSPIPRARKLTTFP